MTFDPGDPQSVRAVTWVVEEVLRRLNHEGVVIVGNGGKKKMASKSRRSRALAIKAQQAMMSPEDDCAWKVRDPDSLTNQIANRWVRQRAIREVWRHLFQITVFNDFVSYIPAEDEAVDACNAGHGNGPGEDMRLDFGHRYLNSRWNSIILRQIYNLILEARVRQGGWGLPDVSEAYIMGELQAQLKGSREAWALVQPRIDPTSGEAESPEQVGTRVESYYKRMADTSSRSLRKRVSSQVAWTSCGLTW